MLYKEHFENIILKSPELLSFSAKVTPMADSSGGHNESDISNINIFVNIDIVSKQMRKYRYFDV